MFDNDPGFESGQLQVFFFRLPIPSGVSGQIKSKQRCASVPVLKSTEEIKDFPFRWDKKPEITGLVGQALVLNSDWLSWYTIFILVRI